MAPGLSKSMLRPAAVLRLTILPLVFLAGLMASCLGEERIVSQATRIPQPTLRPTPTLLPGLPSSTPETFEPDQHDDEDNIGSPGSEAFPTPTPLPTATPTPAPAERLRLGNLYMEHENYSSAADQYQAFLLARGPEDEGYTVALDGLGRALLRSNRSAEAVQVFNQLLAFLAKGDESPAEQREGDKSAQIQADYYFLLGQAYAETGDCQASVQAHQRYLELDNQIAAYVLPLIADCLIQLNRNDEARAAYEEAAAAAARTDLKISNLRRLAEILQTEGAHQEAAETYLQISRLSTSDENKGQAIYEAGFAELLAGNSSAGYGHYLTAVRNYPKAAASYLALQSLLEAEIAVDDFDRGVVDFYAGAYDPAVFVLQRYIGSNPAHDERAHLFLAWCFEALGDISGALTEIDAYIQATEPSESSASQAEDGEIQKPLGKGWIEKAKLLARIGERLLAAESYREYVERYPDGEEGPFAAWWAAALTEQAGDLAGASELYAELATRYPEHEDAPEALFRAGLLLYQAGDVDAGQTIWEKAATQFSHREFGAASVIWLLKSTSSEEWSRYLPLVNDLSGDGFYTIRASDIVSKSIPFAPVETIDFAEEPGLQSEAESWLKALLDLPRSQSIADLPASVLNDGRFIRGESLWRLGLQEEAKLEFEDLRQRFKDDMLTSYQLALHFRDIGLYRSSILAATTILRLTDSSVFTAPAFLGRLAYPVYYQDLILAQAQKYGFDPLLQFSLVRQESLFESFATSSAVAQGLSQVIPATGSYIAGRLRWPDFENDDLYRPYVGIAFGAYYLAQQLDEFDGNVAAALAAYNGGPGNAARWYSEESNDLDRFIEVVDFAETRLYIKRIYTGHAIYRYLYGE